MYDEVNAQYYAQATGEPRLARLRWVAEQRFAVEVDHVTQEWNVRDRTFRWEMSAEALRMSRSVPPQVVIIRDPAQITSWARHFGQLHIKPTGEHSIPLLLRLPFVLPLGSILACIAIYLWVLPFLAERLVGLLPTSVDTRLGDAMYTGMSGELEVDTARSAALQRFGDALHVAPDLTPNYHVVKDAQVNAFALPGGHIVVYTGLLDSMTEAGELAALLAHEGTHVQERHSTRNVARALSGRLFLALVLGDAGGLVGAASQQADALRGLSYSRDLEREADAVGMQRMEADSVDPQGMVDLLALLEKQSDTHAELSFLSTHPMTQERMEDAKRTAGTSPLRGRSSPALEALFDAVRKH